MTLPLRGEDREFYKHLGSLSSGHERQEEYSNYKRAEENACFEMNGRLMAQLPIDPNLVNSVHSIVRARSEKNRCVYRMTSEFLFTPPGPRAILREEFIYPVFLSTTRSVGILQKFIPAFGKPCVLEIEISPGICVSLMEGSGAQNDEDEVLLGAGTTYRIIETRSSKDQRERKTFLGKDWAKYSSFYFVRLRTCKNPIPVERANAGEFFRW